MALTKASYSMVSGTYINVFDFMSAAQIADVESNTGSLDVSDALLACAATITDNSTVHFPPGVYNFGSGRPAGVRGDPNATLCWSPLAISGLNNVTFIGHGAKFILVDVDLSSKALCAIYAEDCTKINYIGFDIDVTAINYTETLSSRAACMDFEACLDVTVQDCRLRAHHPNGNTGGATAGIPNYSKCIGVVYSDKGSDALPPFEGSFKFINNIMHDCYAYTFWVFNSTNIFIQNNRFEHCGYSYLLRLITGAGNMTITGNYFSMPTSQWTRACIGAERTWTDTGDIGTKWIIADNIFYVGESFGGAIELENATVANIENNIIYGTGSPVSTAAINVLGSQFSDSSYRVVIDGNQILYFPNDGIYATGYGVSVTNNIVDTVSGRGVAVNGTGVTPTVESGGVFISGNNIRKTTTPGILVSNIDRALVSENEIISSSSYGIHSTGCTNIAISNNQIKNCTGEGIFLSGTGNNTQINGNYLYGGGTYSIGSDSFSLYGVNVLGNSFVNNTSGNPVILDTTVRGDNNNLGVVGNNVFSGNTDSTHTGTSTIAFNNVVDYVLVP